MNPATILLVVRALDLLIAGITIAPAGLAKIRQLVAENRDPTPDEWAALDTALRSAHSRLFTDGPDA